MEKKGTPDSPATARARSVLPVPGGPTNKTPRGTLPPRRWKRAGSRKKSTISTKILLGGFEAGNVVELDLDRALLLEAVRARPHHAPEGAPRCIIFCALLERKNQTPTMSTQGNTDMSSWTTGGCSSLSTMTLTPCLRSEGNRSGSGDGRQHGREVASTL